VPRAPVFQVVDVFSKRVFNELVESRDGQELCAVADRAFDLLGKPRIMQGDNAKEFVHVLDKHLQSKGIETRHGRPYHPQSQGVVERTNGDFKSKFLAMLYDLRRHGHPVFTFAEINGMNI
jgi:transposase InsO family protein